MAFPRPPIRGEEVVPAAFGGVDKRLRAAEVPMLPEPRSYFKSGSSSPVTTSGAAASSVLTVPIFWRPGNLISVIFVAAFTKSSAGQQCVIDLAGSPFPSVATALFASFEPALVSPSYTPYGTSPSAPGVATIITNGTWPLGPVHKGAHEFETESATAGQFTLDFTVRRSVGAGSIALKNPRAWISVF